GSDYQCMSGTVGIEQLGQLIRRALLVGDRVIPGVGRISEMCGIEKMVVTIDLGFVEDRHNVSFRHRGNRGSTRNRDPAERKQTVRILRERSPGGESSAKGSGKRCCARINRGGSH